MEHFNPDGSPQQAEECNKKSIKGRRNHLSNLNKTKTNRQSFKSEITIGCFLIPQQWMRWESFHSFSLVFITRAY